jgi:hypothetical protein
MNGFYVNTISLQSENYRAQQMIDTREPTISCNCSNPSVETITFAPIPNGLFPIRKFLFYKLFSDPRRGLPYKRVDLYYYYGPSRHRYPNLNTRHR